MDILIKESEKELSQRKKETWDRYTRVINWGRRDPVAFVRRFIKVEMLDFQKYVMYESWDKSFLLWLACRNWGKSAMIDIYTMARSLLIPYHSTYFIGNTGDQAKETFTKMEKLAKGEIESFAGSTDIFLNELETRTGTSDGFIHNPASFRCKLFNGSEIFTLNSDIINIKGKRANLVCYDEAAWFPDELFTQTEQFVNQSQDFKLGVDVNTENEPKGFNRQLLYASSAGDTSSPFYKKYRDFSEMMFIGHPQYFVCDFHVDTVLEPTVNGKRVKALIDQEKIDQAMKDQARGERELYNKFSADQHEGQIVTRRDIMQHEERRPPMLKNDGTHQFIAAYDPARLSDNAILGWAEVYDDPEKGWMMKIHNVISMVDTDTKKKTPLRMPEQVKRIQDTLIDYNGVGKGDYENIKAFVCDAGAGGQMVGGISDQLLDNWIGKDGREHHGVIDRMHKANETALRKFPDAIDIMKLVDPRANRNAIFDAAEQMTKLGVVSFPADNEGRDFIVTIDDDGKEHRYDLDQDELLAMAQIELMKTEIISMCKYSTNGTISYNYPPELRHRQHDDRAFVYGLLCWYLAQLRRGQIINKPTPQKINFLSGDFSFRAPVVKR